MPSDEVLADYNAAYFESAHGGVTEAQIARPFHRAVNFLRFWHVLPYLEKLPKETLEQLRILEMGPGLGDFATHLLARIPAARYSVLESDVSCRNALTERGLTTFGVFDDIPEDAVFDLVVMSHVLEHVANPLMVISKLRRLLQPRGILFIEVPCRDHEHKRVDEPHLLFFDRDPMQKLLVRAGFREIEMTYHGRPLRQLIRESGSATLSTRIVRRLGMEAIKRGLWPVFGPLSAITNREDRAAIWWYQAGKERLEPSWWLRVVATMPDYLGSS
jgi:SAM-dependent methyltransferase